MTHLYTYAGMFLLYVPLVKNTCRFHPYCMISINTIISLVFFKLLKATDLKSKSSHVKTNTISEAQNVQNMLSDMISGLSMNKVGR